tara:strand:- start:2051 stop:2689 length:639 start_codon:yes stop_codon:yes gene_type:complete
MMNNKVFKKTSGGVTLPELAATIVVVSILALAMTSGAKAVMLHYQSDRVRQELRQYGSQILREITRELNLAQKVEIDGQNGFSRIKLYEYFTDISPKLTISCQPETGIHFNNEIPLNGALDFPSEGVFRGPNTRSLYVDDFIVEFDSEGGPGLALFKNSFIKLTLILAMESDVVVGNIQPIKEEHIYYRTVFLGTPYIQTKMTNAMGANNDT